MATLTTLISLLALAATLQEPSAPQDPATGTPPGSSTRRSAGSAAGTAVDNDAPATGAVDPLTNPLLAGVRLLPSASSLVLVVPPAHSNGEALRATALHKALNSGGGVDGVASLIDKTLQQMADATGMAPEQVEQVLASGFGASWHGNTELGDTRWTAVFDLADTINQFPERLTQLLDGWEAGGAQVQREDWHGTVIATVRGGDSPFQGSVAARGHVLVLGNDGTAVQGALRQELRLADGAISLRDNPQYRRFAASVRHVDSCLGAVWLQPGGSWQQLQNQLPPTMRESAELAIAKLGIDGIQGVGIAASVADGKIFETLSLGFPQPRNGLLSAVLRSSSDTGSEDTMAQHAQAIPNGAIAATVANIEWSAVVAGAVDLIESFDIETYDAFIAWEQEMVGQCGVHPRNDLVSNIGARTINAILPALDPAGGTPRSITRIQLRDSWAFAKAFDKMRHALPFPVTPEEHDGVRTYRLGLPGMAREDQPLVALEGQELLITVGAGSFEAWIAHQATPTPDPRVLEFLGTTTAQTVLASWADLDATLPFALPEWQASEEPLGEYRSQLASDRNGFTWTSQSHTGNPALLIAIQLLSPMTDGELLTAVTPAPTPIAEPAAAPHWDPATTLEVIRNAQLAWRAKGEDQGTATGYADLDTLMGSGLDLGTAVFHTPGTWRMDSHLVEVLTQEGAEPSFVVVAWPAFQETGMAYAVLPTGPVLVNDLVAEVAGIADIDPRDVFVDGNFAGELTAGWHPLPERTEPEVTATATAKPAPTKQPSADVTAVGSPATPAAPVVDPLPSGPLGDDARQLAALEEAGNAAATHDITSLTASSNPTVVARACWLLGQLQRGDAAATLRDMAQTHPSASVRRQALGAIYRMGSADCHDVCALALDDKDLAVRTLAAAALGRMRKQAGTEPLLDFLASRDQSIANRTDITQALLALRDIGDPECLQSAASATGEVKQQSGEALAYLYQELSPKLLDREAATLMGVLESPCKLLRRYAIQRLGEVGDAGAARALEVHTAKEDGDLQGLVSVSIDAIRGTAKPAAHPLLDVREKAIGFWGDAKARWHKLAQRERYIVLGLAGVLLLAFVCLIVLMRRSRRRRAEAEAVAFLAPSEGFDAEDEDYDDEDYDEGDYDDGDYDEAEAPEYADHR